MQLTTYKANDLLYLQLIFPPFSAIDYLLHFLLILNHRYRMHQLYTFPRLVLFII